MKPINSDYIPLLALITNSSVNIRVFAPDEKVVIPDNTFAFSTEKVYGPDLEEINHTLIKYILDTNVDFKWIQDIESRGKVRWTSEEMLMMAYRKYKS